MESDNTWGVVAGFVIGVLLAALIVQFGWNIGMVGVLAATGIAQISGISYWTALGVLALSAFARALITPWNRSGTVVQILKSEQDD